jgi:hypothetical protein
LGRKACSEFLGAWPSRCGPIDALLAADQRDARRQVDVEHRAARRLALERALADVADGR